MKKKILVTGALGHLGKSICESFLKKDYFVIAVDKEINENDKFVINLKKKYKDIVFKKCNFESDLEINDLIIFLNKRLNSIDVVVNNASLTGDSLAKGWNVKFSSQSVDNFEKSLKVNLVSIFQLIKGIQLLLKKTRNGSVINITSIYSFLGPDKNLYKDTNIYNPAGYGSSKAGIAQLTRWLASELSPTIRVNSIAAGGIDRNQNKNFKKKYKNKTLLKRMAKENDIVNLIMFLASDQSAYITGQEIIIDGGLSII
jgi:NAD(P)-dependent dehydrogenase (short-subunit alcohol dehydrogenase family)